MEQGRLAKVLKLIRLWETRGCRPPSPRAPELPQLRTPIRLKTTGLDVAPTETCRPAANRLSKLDRHTCLRKAKRSPPRRMRRRF